jgi:NADH dehydrogenase
MVFGQGSPVQQGLRRLATAPVPLVFGSGRVRVQPVHVNDLARCLADIVLAEDAVPLIELGGAEVVELNDLLRRMRRAAGRGEARILHIPAGPVRAMLAAGEALVGPIVPISAGQIASFVNDGIARSSAGACGTLPLEEMIAS